MTEDTCEFCRWARAEYNRNSFGGLCRRRAPGVNIVDINPTTIGKWPGVHMSDYCGDFEHIIVDRGGMP